MKKKLIIMLMLLCVPFYCVKAETTIKSDHVTYENSKTDKQNVKDALDEIREKIESIDTGGDALPSDITKGKTAYVQGELITGTKEERPVYWTTASNGYVYLEGKKVELYNTTNSSGYNVLMIRHNGTELTIKADTATQTVYYSKLYQISSDVVAVYWGSQTVVTDTESDTSTKYTRQEQINYFEYITTYIVKGGVLTKVTQSTISTGAGDTTNYSTYLSRYYYDTYSYSNGTGSITDRTTWTSISESLYSGYDKNMVYIEIRGGYDERYYKYESFTDDYTTTGYWYNTLGINTYTGAQTLGTPTMGTAKHYDDKEKDYYSSSTNYEFAASGLTKITYTDKYQIDMASYSFNDYYGTTKVTSVTSNGLDNGYYVRSFNNLFENGTVYAFNYTSSTNNTTKNITLSIYSSKMGSNASATAYFLANPVYRSESQKFDLSAIMPTDTTISSRTSFYSKNLKQIFVTLNLSNNGKIYLIFGIDDSSFANGSGLKVSLESASYRETSSGGSLVGTIRRNSFDSTNINFYR